MDTVMKTAAGMLIAGAVGGFFWLGLEYPAAFMKVYDGAKVVVYFVFGVPIFAGVISLLTTVITLFQSLTTDKDLPDDIKKEGNAVITVAKALLVVGATLVALLVYARIVKALSQATNPEFYDALSRIGSLIYG
jgi:TRAP-type C4-dicarboxylate transport system permease small subunit